jgi:hypothetical protein
MPAISEIDALKTIDDIFSRLPDQSTRDRVLRWLWSKYTPVPTPGEGALEKSSKPRKPATKNSKAAGKKPKGAKLADSPSLVKDLNLAPKGKTSFADFIEKLKPKVGPERYAACVYWLHSEGGVQTITPNHIFTCFKQLNWRRPGNLRKQIILAASRSGWLNTANTDDIKLTPQGDNLITIDIPKRLADKAK